LFFQPITTPCQHVCPYTYYYAFNLIFHTDFLLQVSPPLT
jgi:hypothetical protein